MFVIQTPRTISSTKRINSSERIQHKEEITTNKAILFGVIALMTVAFAHVQAVDSTEQGQFSASAFSEEVTQSPEDRVRNHFSSDTSSVVASSSDYTMLDERDTMKNHFSTDTSGVISQQTESDSSNEHSAKRLHF